jgi:hypothetical protein
VVRLILVNEGKKPVRVRSVALSATANGRRTPLSVTALAREVSPLQRAAVAEARSDWPEGLGDWHLDAVVTSDRDETAQARLAWR